MRGYYHINVTLNSGIEFITKVDRKDVDTFTKWLEGVPGVKSFVEVDTVSTLKPRSGKNTKIAKARIAAGITQQELADKMGVSVQQEQRWEYNMNSIRIHNLMKVGEALGVEWTSLIED